MGSIEALLEGFQDCQSAQRQEEDDGVRWPNKKTSKRPWSQGIEVSRSRLTVKLLPKVCPKCNSPYWYKPVERVSVSKAVKKHAAKLIFSDVTSTHQNAKYSP